jgi:hypothetical protein
MSRPKKGKAKDPQRVLAARKAARTRRRDNDALAGRGTDPGPACPVCQSRTRLGHDAAGYSHVWCPVCGADNRREHVATA